EARNDDRLAAVLLIEALCLLEMRLLDEGQPAGREARRERVADPVVHGITRDTGNDQQPGKRVWVQCATGGECAGSEQQRSTRQGRRHHEPGLREDDHEQDHVGPSAALADDLFQVYVHVQDEIDEREDPFHQADHPKRPSNGTNVQAVISSWSIDPSSRCRTSVSCCSVRSPSGISMRPPGASWSTSDAGTPGAAAATRIASYGA